NPSAALPWEKEKRNARATNAFNRFIKGQLSRIRVEQIMGRGKGSLVDKKGALPPLILLLLLPAGRFGGELKTTTEPLSPATAKATPLSRARRVGLWAIAWGVAALATVAPAFPLLFFCWLFPMGLAAPVGASDWSSDATNVTLIVGWGLYLVLTIYGLRQQQRERYLFAYGLLIALLTLNVAGCRYEVAHIHFGC